MKKNGAIAKAKPKKPSKAEKARAADSQSAPTEAGQVRGLGRKTVDIKMVAMTCARLGKVHASGNKTDPNQDEEEDKTPKTPTTETTRSPDVSVESPVVPRRLFCSQLLTEEQKTGKVRRDVFFLRTLMKTISLQLTCKPSQRMPAK